MIDTDFTPAQLRAAEIDIANTARAARWHAENYAPLTNDDDRALEERLACSVRQWAWRRKADLPAKPQREAVTGWRARVALMFSMGGYRRRHPITTPPSAA